MARVPLGKPRAFGGSTTRFSRPMAASMAPPAAVRGWPTLFVSPAAARRLRDLGEALCATTQKP